jgi:hypothetical protein
MPNSCIKNNHNYHGMDQIYSNLLDDFVEAFVKANRRKS